MKLKFTFSTIFISLTLVMMSTLISASFATTNDDPRSDRACDEMVDLEGFQDTRTEPDSTIPSSDRGTEKANEGAHKALGDCPLG